MRDVPGKPHGATGSAAGQRHAAAPGVVPVQRAHGILAQIIELAVRDRRLPANPARGVRLPRKLARAPRYLTAAQVEALAVECEPYGHVVRFLAFTGLRWGEMAALRVRDVDLLRRRIHVSRSVTEDHRRLIFDTTKTGQARMVPLPRFLADQVAVTLAGKGPDDVVFQGARGGVLRNRNFGRSPRQHGRSAYRR